MSDKMPDDLYARRVGKKKFSAVTKESPLALGGVVAFNEARPAKPRTRYVRADLPKEVDLGELKKSEPWPQDYETQETGEFNSEDFEIDCWRKKGWNDCLDHLVALGVIRDKPTENKEENHD